MIVELVVAAATEGLDNVNVTAMDDIADIKLLRFTFSRALNVNLRRLFSYISSVGFTFIRSNPSVTTVSVDFSWPLTKDTIFFLPLTGTCD
jgi:hypothetical protein